MEQCVYAMEKRARGQQMLGYSGYVVHFDYFIDVHKTKESAMEFLKQLAYESGESQFVVGVAVKKDDGIVLEFPDLYQYDEVRKEWYKLW